MSQPLALATTLDQNLMRDPSFRELSSGGVESIPGAVLVARDERGFGEWGFGFGSELSGEEILGHVPQNDADFGVECGDDVEPINGFGSVLEVGVGEVPVELDLGAMGVEDFGAFFFAEETGVYVEFHSG